MAYILITSLFLCSLEQVTLMLPYHLFKSEDQIDREIERSIRRAEYLRDTEMLEQTSTRNGHKQNSNNSTTERASDRAARGKRL